MSWLSKTLGLGTGKERRALLAAAEALTAAAARLEAAAARLEAPAPAAGADPALLDRLDRLIEETRRSGAAAEYYLHQLPGLARLAATEAQNARSDALVRFSGQVYSQCAEDGILAELFRRVPPVHRIFLEIGVGDGSENTTRLLLETGWSGQWIEGDPAGVAAARTGFAGHIAASLLTVTEAMVTRENVAGLVDPAVAERLDYLSVDVDQNTAYIWEALGALRPRVVCIEYNAHFPASLDFVVPYDPVAVWDGSNVFGASLKALERIGRGLGYRLVGCDICGVNAFFVRDDLAAPFPGPFDAESLHQPPRYELVRPVGHPRRRPDGRAPG